MGDNYRMGLLLYRVFFKNSFNIFWLYLGNDCYDKLYLEVDCYDKRFYMMLYKSIY